MVNIGTNEISLFLEMNYKRLLHNSKGISYLTYILYLLCNDEDLRDQRKTMILYELAAKKYGGQSKSISAAIHYTLRDYHTTNGKFIYRAADAIVNNSYRKQYSS